MLINFLSNWQRVPTRLWCVVALVMMVACGRAADFRIESEGRIYSMDAATMALRVTSGIGADGGFSFSEPTQGLGEVRGLKVDGNTSATWTLPERGIAVAAQAGTSGTLVVRITSVSEETSFTWPSQRLVASGTERAELLWPRGEGLLIPLDDATWRAHLMSEKWNTLEGIGLPFWGVKRADGVASVVLDTQFLNAIQFFGVEEETSSPLRLDFTHEFRTGEPRTLAITFAYDATNQILAPALHYRAGLIARSEFVSMRERIAAAPATERLLGAPHVYLWGGGILTRHDVEAKKAHALTKRIYRERESTTAPLSRALWQQFSKDERTAVAEYARGSYPRMQYGHSGICDSLARVLRDCRITSDAVEATSDTVSADVLATNCRVIQATFTEFLPPVEAWGGGFSTRMIEAFQRAGLTRLRLCVDGWEKMAGRAAFSQAAIDAGYLIGPYDSYHSIHDPAWKGSEKTWPTAQFDQTLFEQGPIMDRNGKKHAGFQKKGFLLSPAAAEPAMRARTAENFALAPFNYYFFDCDGFGQVFDNFAPKYRQSQQDDANSRSARLKYVAQKFGAPVGTEGGSAYAVPASAVCEGIFAENFGWGDADLKDRKSPYFLGAYHPPDAPAVFFKSVPMKDDYRRMHFDPKYRVPLWEAVYHDSSIGSHHWSVPSHKFANVAKDFALMEMLYQVPPMYHVNPEEFARLEKRIVAHDKAFREAHRESALLALDEFVYLTPDRAVQRTTFGGGALTVTSNFGTVDHADAAAGTAVVRRRGQADSVVFRP